MEASVAAAADGPETPESAAEPSLADIQASLQTMGSDMESLREQLSAAPQAPAEPVVEEEPPEPEEIDYSFLNEQQYQADPDAALKQLSQVIRDEARKVAQEAVTPVRQEVQQERETRELDALSQRYPQLQDEKVAAELIKQSQAFMAESGLPKEHATNPRVLEKLFLASRARAQNEDDPNSTAATLEGAGGASPGGAGQGAEQETGRQVMERVAPKRLGLFTGGS